MQFIRTLLYIEELLIASGNFFIIYFLMARFHAFYEFDIIPGAKSIMPAPHSIDLYLRVFWLVLALWAVLLRVRGEYHHLRIQTYYKVAMGQFVNGVIFFALFSSGAFLFKFDFLSRFFILFYTVSTILYLMTNRLFVLWLAYYVRRKGYNFRNILLVGTGRRAQEFLSLVAMHKEWGYRVLGLLDKDADVLGKKIAGYEVMGTLQELPRLLENNIVDEVVFVVPRSWLKEIENCILYCEAVGVPATLSTDFFDLEVASGVPKEIEGFTYLTFETSRLKDSELVLKRMLDIVFALFFLVVLAPFFLLLSLLVKLDSPGGPIFFRQRRCSRNGREFMLYKFRSMVPDAEKKLEELKKLNEMSGPVFKIAKDPRLTRIGKFLRKTSLDEIPQFWNVLKGDMSLVGPRPPLPKEVEQYEPWQRRRLSMKPGITCIWQVSGRNQIDFDDWMRLDLQYIDRWSLWLDFKIILMTIKAVLTARGAK